MDRTQAHRYLDHLRVDPRPPSREALTELTTAHLARVPFENFSKRRFTAPLNVPASSAFFFHILWVMRKVIKEGKEGISPKGQKILSSIWVLFLISWFLYPGAYLMPHLAGIEGYFYSEDGVMARQLTYTIADVSSKVIYGVLLGNLAMVLSKGRTEDEVAKA